jgi:antitoxin component of MazEF toxin-antitoxin module
MAQKVIQIGNSTGVIIPKSILKSTGLGLDSRVEIKEDKLSDSIIISKIDSDSKYSPTTTKVVEMLDKVNQNYGQALKQLAGK